MPTKFVSRAAYLAAAIYPGTLALTHRGNLWDALKAAIGLTDVDRTVITASGTLTVTQCGTLLVDATAGDIVLTLPASGVDADEALYEIDRLDATANTVTFEAAGADTVAGAADVEVLGTMRLRLPAGSTDWRVHGIGGSTPAKAREALGVQIAPGQIAHFPFSSAPAGWIKANGALISRTTYAALFAAADADGLVSEATWSAGSSARFSVGDGTTTFRLPDLRGEVIRGWDDSRGVDTSRAIGTMQLDALQGHEHQISVSLTLAGGGSGQNVEGGGSGQPTDAIISNGVNGTPRIASETRMRNVALLACVKY